MTRIPLAILALFLLPACAARHIYNDVSVIDPCPRYQIQNTCNESIIAATFVHEDATCVCICPPGWQCDWVLQP